MRFAQLSQPARAYLLGTYLLALGLVLVLLPRDAAGLELTISDTVANWPVFVPLLLATTLAHSFPVNTPNRQSYYVSLPFFAAAVLLVAPLQLAMILIVPNLVEWKRQRRSWVAQAFNVAAYVITGLAAQAIYHALQPVASVGLTLDDGRAVMAAVAAVLGFLALNRGLVSGAIALANRLPPFGVAELESIAGEGVLLAMGLPLAFLVQAVPWALLPASAPLLLAHRALAMPHMRAERRHDELTGMFTLAYLIEVCNRELNRARRFGRPLALLLVEVGDVEAITGAYGREACDTVIRKAAQALARATREYDVAAHIGGGRFAVLLPEADAERAATIAGRLQTAIADQRVEVPTSLEPLRVSLRVGIAARVSDDDTAAALIEAAESALASAAADSPVLPASHAGQQLDAPANIAPSTSTPTPRTAPIVVLPVTTPEPVLASTPAIGPHRAGGNRWVFVALQVLIGLVTLGIVISGAPGVLAVDPWATLWMVGFVGLAELLGLELFGTSTSYSISTVPIIAAGLLLGPAGAIIVAPTGMLLRAIHLRTRWYKAVFNVNTHIIAAVAATSVFHILSPRLDIDHLAWLLIPSALAGATFYLHTMLVALAIGTDMRVSPVRVWLDNFRWLWIQYVVLGMMGLLLAVAYHSFGLLGAAIFVVPPVMMRYVAKQFLDKSMDHLRQLRALNEHLASEVNHRKESEALLEHQALHDVLTGLPNRLLLRDRTQQALLASERDGQPMALLLLDLDRFKEVNDTLGHHAGDLLLKEAAHRFQAALPESDTIARLGGDEFAALLPTATTEAAISTAQRLLAVLEVPFELDGRRVDVRASIGIARIEPGGDTSEALLRRADVAMYTAKRATTGYALYTVDEDQNSPEQLALAADLRVALADNQLELHYQPKLDLRTGGVTSVEALVRWHHPRRGLLPPLAFIPLAESIGLIDALSEWVLNAGLRQCRVWRDMGLHLTVAVNLSMRNLHDPHLPDTIAGLLGVHGLVPESLVLEITESTLMADPKRALAIVSALRHLGVRLSIDDFGTGYSSLVHLKQLPVDELKIDQGFVRQLATSSSDAAIVRSTIALAHELGLTVVAEGVEERRVCELLAGYGCDVAQGYYISRPVPADQVPGLLHSLATAARSSALAA